ncbi:MAG: CHASE2 domain-containing protein [Solirubrobacteraceae bacterium]
MSADAPYVGLDYFLEEDAGLFFGRDAERKRIVGNLRASRLTLLYAESGVGKSSLLRAGVSARLRQLAARSVEERGSARYVPVVFSAWQGDSKAELITALEAAVRPLLRDGAQLALPRDALEDAIGDAAAAVDATPLIILDQFEERFVYETDDDGFDDELAHCINRRDLRANFLISVREDAYPQLGPRFKARIANVYGNYLHLDFLDERAARDAILEPVNAFNERLPGDAPRFEVEGALVDAVVEQVRRGRVTIGDAGAPETVAAGPARVETAYLQLVMKRLWDEEMTAGSQRLRLETLQRLGGADTIVHGHLDDVMAELPEEQRDAAAAAFRFLVTSGGRKIPLSSEELLEFSDAPAESLEPALEHLERARILRRVPAPEPDATGRREIYHDVLAPAIRDWRRRHHDERTERDLARARERARRLEVRNRRLAAAVVALLVVGVALALYVVDPAPVERLELATVDARFSFRPARPADPRLMLIAVDDRTLDRLGAAPARGEPRILRRAAYARMLERFREDGAAAIAIDVIFQGPQNPQNDGELLAAIRANRGRVVLASNSYNVALDAQGNVAPRANLFESPDDLSGTGAKTGYAGLPDDVDGGNRRADYQVELSRPASADDEVPAKFVNTFAFATADVVLPGPLGQHVDELPTASRRAEGAQSERTTWIDFRGPPGNIPRMSALEVLDGRVPPGTFAGKVLVVGNPVADQDVFDTPVDGDGRMAGPEVQANAIDTMLRESPLRDVPQEVDILAILLLAAIPALAVSLSASRAVYVAAIAGGAALFLAAAQLAFYYGWILAVALPLAALVASAACVAALAAARMARHGRARSGTAPGRSP